MKTREEKIRELQDYFHEAIYYCTRDHSAWSYGTMGLDDFAPAWDDLEILDSIADIFEEES